MGFVCLSSTVEWCVWCKKWFFLGIFSLCTVKLRWGCLSTWWNINCKLKLGKISLWVVIWEEPIRNIRHARIHTVNYIIQLSRKVACHSWARLDMIFIFSETKQHFCLILINIQAARCVLNVALVKTILPVCLPAIFCFGKAQPNKVEVHVLWAWQSDVASLALEKWSRSSSSSFFKYTFQ